MRQFTDAEKQQLEAKIKDEQERQIQIVKELVQRNDGAPPKKSTAAKYVYLGFFLCMLALQAFTFILLIGRNLGFYQFGGLMFVLWVLFDWIAVYFTKTGWQRRVMTTVARIWFVFTLAYGVWILSEVSFPLMAGYVVLIIIFFVVWPGSFRRNIFGKNSRYN
jgi:hypothetical protein